MTSAHRNQGAGVRPVRSMARAVGAALPDVTRKAFERHGFPAATLIMDWHVIVGADFASFTLPEKLKWPRKRPDLESDLAPDPMSRQAGACLTVRVDGARALELQHRLTELNARINMHFGYRAVTDIRILQAPVVCSGATQPNLARRERPETVAPHVGAKRSVGHGASSVRANVVSPISTGVADGGARRSAETDDNSLENALARLQDGIRAKTARTA